MSDENKRMRILEMIERGEVTTDEGLRLLRDENIIDQAPSSGDVPSFDEASPVDVEPSEEIHQDHLPSEADEAEAAQTSDQPPAKEPTGYGQEDAETIPGSADEADQGYSQFEEAEVYSNTGAHSMPSDVDKWRRWWTIPLWIGVGIVVISSLFMLYAFQASGLGFWFFCTSVFFALGLLILVLAAQSRSARWLHLRVKQRPGQRPQNIAISFPIPLRFASWAMRIFGGFMPNTPGASPEDILTALDALEDSATPETPFYIKVDDEDGEHVEIYIG